MWAWATGEMRPVIDDRQANPTVGKAINGGYDLLEAKCKRCRHLSLVSLRDIRRPARTPILMLEDALVSITLIASARSLLASRMPSRMPLHPALEATRNGDDEDLPIISDRYSCQ